ncbi:MAG: hypothetical protein JRN21_04810 [Nitrososphaerota archaeon]|nr:hypothetical protein [Nitrososphaerota archaeon]
MDAMRLAHALTDRPALGYLAFDYKVSNKLKKMDVRREGFVIGDDPGF